MAGIPPVVNGQWIKGVGGAAVWSPIAQSDLPANVGPSTATPTDWNAVAASGWYLATGAANAPAPGTWYGLCVAFSSAWQTQTLTESVSAGGWPRVFTRQLSNGTWGPWLRQRQCVAAGLVNNTGAIIHGSGFTVAHTSAGNFTITITNGFSSSQFEPMATPNGQSIVIGTAQTSNNAFNVYITTPSAWYDAPFSFAVFDSFSP
jgi:hypothetical protein